MRKRAGALHHQGICGFWKHGLNGTPELIEELQGLVKQRITPYKYPRRIEFLDELPKNATGKLLRYKLRERELSAKF